MEFFTKGVQMDIILVLPLICALKVAIKRLLYFSCVVTQEFRLYSAAANEKWLSRKLIQLSNKKADEVLYVIRTN